MSFKRWQVPQARMPSKGDWRYAHNKTQIDGRWESEPVRSYGALGWR
ncbi:hypothetical protein [Alkalilimnicola ehrlichii]|nr:hypothetical protein [Alkalilimnicola ehrlichii]